MIKLGTTVEDIITGFTGMVTGRVEYISGCNQLLVQPRVDKNGAFQPQQWFDEERCSEVGGNPGVLAEIKRKLRGASGSDMEAPKR